MPKTIPQSERHTELRATILATDAATGTIEGMAVKYGVKIPRGQRLSEEVGPGAFSAQVGAPNRVAVLWQHNSDDPIGRVSTFKDSAEELKFSAKISESADIPEARKALALLREGIVDEISVGFDWGTWELQESDEGTNILHTKGRLRELSVVTFGALGRDARVVTVASESDKQEALAYRARLARLRA